MMALFSDVGMMNYMRVVNEENRIYLIMQFIIAILHPRAFHINVFEYTV